MNGGTVENLEEKDSCGLFQCTPLHSPGRTEKNHKKISYSPETKNISIFEYENTPLR
jgi:hypothetical protein